MVSPNQEMGPPKKRTHGSADSTDRRSAHGRLAGRRRDDLSVDPRSCRRFLHSYHLRQARRSVIWSTDDGVVHGVRWRSGFNSQVGAGTTFFFELPEWKQPAILPPPLRVQAAASSRPCILILEDDPDVARLISMMLDNAGFETEMAHSVAQAFACLARKSFAAVTVDLMLPDPSGAAFISALRGDERTRHLPVVVISAMAEEGLLQFNHKPHTVSDWIEKPIDENRLILSVRRAVTGVKSGKPCVLHVEDDLDIQRIVAEIAGDFAHFEFAATLDQARARLREQRFDLVLLDLALGQDSGWDLFEDIDALDPRPPVIVFSASAADPPDGKQTEAVLLKTYTSNAELLNTIQRALHISGDPGPTRPQTLS